MTRHGIGQTTAWRAWRPTVAASVVAATAMVAAVAVPGVARAATRTTPTLTQTYEAPGPTTLSDVACPSPSLCLALGADEFPIGTTEGSVVYRSTNGGATWAPSSLPNGFGDAMSCSSVTFCVIEASGLYTGRLGFAITRDGGLTWSDTEPLNLVANALPTLSCVEPGTCLTTYKGRVVSTTDAGAHWRMHRATHVVGVDCLTERYCDVVQRAAAHGRTTLEFSRSASRGGRLAYLSTLSVRAGSVVFGSMTCGSVDDCDVATSGRTASLYVTTDGGRRWSAHALASGSYPHVWALSCTSPGACTALVGAADGSSSVLAASTTDAGDRWSVAATSAHDTCDAGGSGCPAVSTPSVACTAVARCVATAGNDDLYEGTSSTWTATPIAEGAANLEAAACTPGSDTCLAVGDGVEAVSTDDGQSWSVHADATFAGAGVHSLTCPFGTTCLASVFVPAANQVLVSTDDGATWTVATVPSGVLYVSSLMCPSTTTCVGVPTVTSNPATTPAQLLRSTDGGRDWSLLTPAPASDYAAFSGVTCTTSTHCLAVGNSSTFTAMSATSDDAGATWTLTEEPSHRAFYGVSCSSATSCVTHDATTTVFGSTDGGTTWTTLGSAGTEPVTGWRELDACGTAGTCWGIASLIEDEGVLMDSTDGGTTWSIDDQAANCYPLQLTNAPDGALIVVCITPSMGTAILTST